MDDHLRKLEGKWKADPGDEAAAQAYLTARIGAEGWPYERLVRGLIRTERIIDVLIGGWQPGQGVRALGPDLDEVRMQAIGPADIIAWLDGSLIRYAPADASAPADPEDQALAPPLDVPCPLCSAPAGAGCSAGGVPAQPIPPHQMRIAFAVEWAANNGYVECEWTDRMRARLPGTAGHGPVLPPCQRATESVEEAAHQWTFIPFTGWFCPRHRERAIWNADNDYPPPEETTPKGDNPVPR